MGNLSEPGEEALGDFSENPDPPEDYRDRLIANKVRIGALHLDAIMPGWVTRVDPSAVDMNSPTKCIVGQIWGSWNEAKEMVGSTSDAREARGFFNWFASDDPTSTKHWRREILARREA